MAYDGQSYSSLYSDTSSRFSEYRYSGASADVDAPEDIEGLKKQASRLSHLLQVMPAGVIVLDGQGVVRQANGQASELLGEPLEGELWRTIITRSFKPRADDGHEVSLIDGRRVKLSITPLENEPGQLIVLTDLTETRELQARVSHMQRLSALGKMVASLAHQIRTPLSAAMLYAANMKRKGLGEQATQDFAGKLTDRLRELESQVNDMLLFAKSGEDQVVAELSMVQLADAIGPSAQTMTQQAGQTLHISGFDCGAAVTGNLTALQGAILHLIHNASQVSPQGAAIFVTAVRSGDRVAISVIDHGPGVPMALRQKIFEPFYTTKTHGTGLGLAVVKSVVNAHKGQLGVTNLEGQGACFTLTLPVTATQPSSFSPAITGDQA